jgi:UDP-glucuronate 4-epimerase
MAAVVVTGAAGFIGHHVTRALLDRGERVIGIDNLNAYYDVALKEDRLAAAACDRFTFIRGDICDRELLERVISDAQATQVLHLAAQPGVRHSARQPSTHVNTNIVGFANVLEVCRDQGVEHLVFASSSSVYGEGAQIPYQEDGPLGVPLSVYAASKRAGEHLAHAYGHTFDLRSTGLRFFTVYGPWGRPDMAVWSFAERILNGETLDVFGRGEMARDFTYIDDIVAGILEALDLAGDPQEPARVFNIGRGEPVSVNVLIELLERRLALPAKRRELPRNPAEAERTHANIDRLVAATGYEPKVSLAEGLDRFVTWFLERRGA